MGEGGVIPDFRITMFDSRGERYFRLKTADSRFTIEEMPLNSELRILFVNEARSTRPGDSYQRMNMHYVYVIKSAEGRYYIGSTQDVEKRLKQHNSPANRGWTNRFTGWVEVYREECNTRLEARRRERELKKMRGNKRDRMLKGLSPDSAETAPQEKEIPKGAMPGSRPRGKVAGRKRGKAKAENRTAGENTDRIDAIHNEKTAGRDRRPRKKKAGKMNTASENRQLRKNSE